MSLILSHKWYHRQSLRFCICIILCSCHQNIHYPFLPSLNITRSYMYIVERVWSHSHHNGDHLSRDDLYTSEWSVTWPICMWSVYVYAMHVKWMILNWLWIVLASCKSHHIITSSKKYLCMCECPSKCPSRDSMSYYTCMYILPLSVI